MDACLFSYIHVGYFTNPIGELEAQRSTQT